MFKILHLDECQANPMEPGRGDQIKLINPSLGTEKVDVHLNAARLGGPRGKLSIITPRPTTLLYREARGGHIDRGWQSMNVIRENDVVYLRPG